VLAGFMRILGREAMERFPDRIVNIHPSLLPAFPGANAVAKALEYGVKQTGVTVHFVDEEVDHGPIIAQVPVEVLPDDDVGTLHARIQQQEHVLYPAVVDALVRGGIRVSGRRLEGREQGAGWRSNAAPCRCRTSQASSPSRAAWCGRGWRPSPPAAPPGRCARRASTSRPWTR